MGFRPNTVYFVDSDLDSSALLALDAKISEHGVEWFDTSRDRIVAIVELEEIGDAVRVIGEQARYEFRPLTLELYNDRVVGHVVGAPMFRSTEEIQEFYQRFPR